MVAALPSYESRFAGRYQTDNGATQIDSGATQIDNGATYRSSLRNGYRPRMAAAPGPDADGVEMSRQPFVSHSRRRL
jgi:hypothetical protein